jgi:hypothetical protein
MGLYSVPVKAKSVEKIPLLLRFLGLQVTEIKEDEIGVHYFYTSRRRPNRKFSYWITSLSDERPPRFNITMSKHAEQIMDLLDAWEVFIESLNRS